MRFFTHEQARDCFGSDQTLSATVLLSVHYFLVCVTVPYVTTLLSFTAGALDKFRSACVKCRYTESYSVTAMLTELNLYKFDSLVDKCRSDFQRQIHACGNGIVQHFV